MVTVNSSCCPAGLVWRLAPPTGAKAPVHPSTEHCFLCAVFQLLEPLRNLGLESQTATATEETRRIPAVAEMLSLTLTKFELETGESSVQDTRVVPSPALRTAALTKEPPEPSAERPRLSPAVEPASIMLAFTIKPDCRNGWPNRLISIGDMSSVMQRFGVMLVGSPSWMVLPDAQPAMSATSLIWSEDAPT